MLLGFVKELIERIRGQADSFCDERYKLDANGSHLKHVFFIYRPESRNCFFVRPLVRREEVVVERSRCIGDRMSRGEVNLFSPVCLEACDLISKFTVSYALTRLFSFSIPCLFSSYLCKFK